jgi:hypothetical protein
VPRGTAVGIELDAAGCILYTGADCDPLAAGHERTDETDRASQIDEGLTR